MDTPPKDKQDLYDRIRQSSRDEVILDEMQRLGFWPRGESPEGPEAEIRRIGELQQELRSLTTENTRLQNTEALRKAANRKRLEESRRKRKERKEQKERERQQRAERWALRAEREIVYLGAGVSGGLNDLEADLDKLTRHGLTSFENPASLAARIGITLNELRFLAYHRRVSRVTHYRRFRIAKKTGGHRHISAPMPRLKNAQRWILENILQDLDLADCVHGFRRDRSIVTNAQPHVGADVVLNVDIKDFFPSVTFRRVKGLFRSLGYSECIAAILALLCTEPDTVEVLLDGRVYHVARGERVLPQGAPTSPAITNLICRGLDARLTGVARKMGFQYTRYADDISMSARGEAAADVARVLRQVRHIVGDEGFVLHPDKTRVIRSSRRQEVTGIVVNRRVNISRKLLRRFRATMRQIELDGPQGKCWCNGGDVIAAIEGFANFVAMVDADKGAKYQQRVAAIVQRYGRPERPGQRRQRWRRPDPPVRAVAVPDATTAATGFTTPSLDSQTAPPKPGANDRKAAKKPWWKFW